MTTTAKSHPTQILRENLTLLIERDERSISELARACDEHFPGRGADAWRKMINRTIGTNGSWWPTPDLAKALTWLFGLEHYGVLGTPGAVLARTKHKPRVRASKRIAKKAPKKLRAGG